MSIMKFHVDLSGRYIAQTSCFDNLSAGTTILPDSNCAMITERDGYPTLITSNVVINPEFKRHLFSKNDKTRYAVTFIRNTNFRYTVGGNTLVNLEIKRNPKAKMYFNTIYVLKVVDPVLFYETVIPGRNADHKYEIKELLDDVVAPKFKVFILDKLANAAGDYGHANIDKHEIHLSLEVSKLLNNFMAAYGLEVVDVDPSNKGVDDEYIDAENRFKMQD